MNNYRNKLLDILIDLKENYNICSIKAEFGEEGTNIDEAAFLKDLAKSAGLDFTLKVGGCEALKDILDTKSIGATTIVAPMIESVYALKKFVKVVKTAFEDNIPENIQLYINIETVTGYNNLNSILNCEEASLINGIVLGRTDMALSMDKTKNQVEDNEIYEIALDIANLAHKYNKRIIIGGNISTETTKFIEKLYPEYIDGIETRKIVFNINSSNVNKISDGIIKAINFELTWLEYKATFGPLTGEDYKRIKSLKNKCKILVNN